MHHGRKSTKIIPLSRWVVSRAVVDLGARDRVITMGSVGGHCSIIWTRLMFLPFRRLLVDLLRQPALPPVS